LKCDDVFHLAIRRRRDREPLGDVALRESEAFPLGLDPGGEQGRRGTALALGEAGHGSHSVLGVQTLE
jgi:hypothetical protein